MGRFGAIKVVRARQIFSTGERKFWEWRKNFLVVVGDFSDRGGKFAASGRGEFGFIINQK